MDASKEDIDRCLFQGAILFDLSNTQMGLAERLEDRTSPSALAPLASLATWRCSRRAGRAAADFTPGQTSIRPPHTY